MNYNYIYYKEIMNYVTFAQKYSRWSLPYIHKWYVKYLHEKFWEIFTYRQFAHWYKKYWYNFIKDIENFKSSKLNFKSYWQYLSHKTPNDW